MIDSAIQTIQINSSNAEVQTDREISRNYVSIINRSMHEINNLIEA